MVSFDVKTLFTNVLLEYTIDFVLKRIYENHEVSTSLTRNEMREILLLCTKTVHLTFRDVIYLQTDGVAMGSPLEPVSPHSWKRGTLKTLTQRAYMICSTTELLDTELKNLEKVFLEKNNFRNGQLGKFSHKLSLLMAVIRHHLLSKQ